MDTSKQYVKMCEGADEIQKLGPVLVKTYWEDMVHIDTTGNFWYLRIMRAIWLPRQDQLQEMIDRSNYARPERQLIEDFYAFINPESKTRDYDWESDMMDYVASFTSMEHLWLAFVMKERYGKTWDGNKWVIL